LSNLNKTKLNSKALLVGESATKNLRFAPLYFLALGILSVVLFHGDIFFPISVSVAIMTLVVTYFFLQLRARRIGVLMVLLLLVYLLPFIHIPPYLWYDFNSSPIRLWGLAVRPYMLNELIIELTAMIIVTGALGIAFTVSLTSKTFVRDSGLNANNTRRKYRSLSFPIWFIWVFIGVALSYVSAPKDTIFFSAYTSSDSIVENLNFASSWMMSYIILSFVFVDALIDQNTIQRNLKWKIILISIAYIVVWLQLFRGDRAALPWTFSLLIVNYYWLRGFLKMDISSHIPLFKISIWIFILFAVTMIIGAVRYQLTGIDIIGAIELIKELSSAGHLGLSNMLSGTWSAVLLTPLSVAGDHIHHILRTNWGEDYLNILLSLPPGFVTDIFDYERPLSATSGPAWEMRYGLGGTHASVVPFMNFRMVGVFIVPALWAYLFQYFERKSMRYVSVINISLLMSIALSSAHFLWYGEKYGINAIILWMIFAFFYRVSMGFCRNHAFSLSGKVSTGNHV
jgi:hypothetical protein